MIRRSVVLRLWIIIVALIVIALGSTLLAVTTVVTDSYVNMRVDELTRHGEGIVRLELSGGLAGNAGQLIDLVAATSGAMVMLIRADGTILNCSARLTVTDPAHIRALADVSAALAGRRSWSVARDPLTGQPSLNVALPLLRGGEPAVVLMVAPAGPVQQTVVAVERTIVIVAGAAVVAVTLLALFLSRRVSQPLLAMAAAAADMADGDLTRRVKVTSDDEVGQLGQSMNNLAAQLQQTVAALGDERDQLSAVLERERQVARTQKEFVANVSHELRTPLSYLQGYSEAILDGLIKPEDQPRYVQMMLAETQRLRRLVADLLDLTVIESGQAPLRPERLPLGGLVHDVTVALQPLADANGVTLREPCDAAASLTVWADPDRTKQVLVNLLDNALRHSPRGTRVSISCARDDADPERVWVAVADQGPGLAPELLTRVWDRFFKADPARRRDASGTGLGLAIVRGIVEAQGGRVRVTSEPGHGATFAFSLPVAAAAE